jgi:serine protease inhibitor
MGTRLASLFLVAALVAVACGGDDDAASGPPPASAREVVSDLARVDPSPDAPVAAVVRGIDDFAFEFQRLVASESENLVFSPASIATGFAMAHAGASEQTQRTLEAAFGFPDVPDMHEAMNALSPTRTRRRDQPTGRGRGSERSRAADRPAQAGEVEECCHG